MVESVSRSIASEAIGELAGDLREERDGLLVELSEREQRALAQLASLLGAARLEDRRAVATALGGLSRGSAFQDRLTREALVDLAGAVAARLPE